mmetsp:Transcript_24054/g.44957  ORF Transcript_24054/g.44957 Transcript_24054/m.44957 type:complete len:250 (+) Transcript_24054:222-971(+)
MRSMPQINPMKSKYYSQTLFSHAHVCGLEIEDSFPLLFLSYPLCICGGDEVGAVRVNFRDNELRQFVSHTPSPPVVLLGLVFASGELVTPQMLDHLRLYDSLLEIRQPELDFVSSHFHQQHARKADGVPNVGLETVDRVPTSLLHNHLAAPNFNHGIFIPELRDGVRNLIKDGFLRIHINFCRRKCAPIRSNWVRVQRVAGAAHRRFREWRTLELHYHRAHLSGSNRREQCMGSLPSNAHQNYKPSEHA